MKPSEILVDENSNQAGRDKSQLERPAPATLNSKAQIC